MERDASAQLRRDLDTVREAQHRTQDNHMHSTSTPSQQRGVKEHGESLENRTHSMPAQQSNAQHRALLRREQQQYAAERRMAHVAIVSSHAKELRRDMGKLSRYVRQWQDKNTSYLAEMQQVVRSIAQQEQLEMEKNYREASGYLIKRGAKVKSWKRRWFLFKPDLTFSYYASADSSKAINTVDVSSGLFEVYPDNTHKMDFVFKIVTGNRIFFMSASSTEELSRWIHFLRFWRSVNTKKMVEGGNAVKKTSAIGKRRP